MKKLIKATKKNYLYILLLLTLSSDSKLESDRSEAIKCKFGYNKKESLFVDCSYNQDIKEKTLEIESRR